MPQSEPGLGGAAIQPQAIPGAYSTAPGDGANRAARADAVAANHIEDNQTLPAGNKKARIDDVTKLVAEENASRSKFPQYSGLERWELLEKMGDGAFSNVYRARDLEGNAGEVAIKVVRKFEMSSMQVSLRIPPAVSVLSQHPSSPSRPTVSCVYPLRLALRCDLCAFQPARYTNAKVSFSGPETSSSGLQAKGSQSRRGAKDFIFSFSCFILGFCFFRRHDTTRHILCVIFQQGCCCLNKR